MELLVNLLMQELNNINNSIIDIQTIPSRIDDVLSKFNSETILSLSIDDFEFIKSLSNLNLTNSELKFLDPIFSNNNEIREIFSELGFDNKQIAIILNIKRKIEAVKFNYTSLSLEDINAELERCKNLLMQINNRNANIITDLMYIKNLLDKNNISIDEQNKIFMAINDSNLRFYNSFSSGIHVNNGDEAIDESELIETNLDEEKVKGILERYNINYDEINDKLKLKLLRYGNYDNIEQVLNTLKNNGFEKIFNMYEILVKTLIFSTSTDIEETIRLARENNIFDILTLHPTILFPEARESGIRIRRGGRSGESSISGARNRFRNNIELLKANGINIEKASKKCSTLFVISTNTIRNSFLNLKLYGIKDFSDINHLSLNMLCGANQTDRLDIGIECGLYEYCLGNLSSIFNNRTNFYRVKYCDKLRKNGDVQAPPNPFRVLKDGTQKLELASPFNTTSKNSPYGNKKEDTFKLYGAVLPTIESVAIYDKVVELNEANKITQLSLNHPIIKHFDSLYKKDNITYSFEGVVISRYKVIRYFELFISEPNIEMSDDLLLYIITRNSMLDSEELETINKCIKEMKKVRRLVI